MTMRRLEKQLYPTLSFHDQPVVTMSIQKEQGRFVITMAGAYVAGDRELEGVRLEITHWKELVIRRYLQEGGC